MASAFLYSLQLFSPTISPIRAMKNHCKSQFFSSNRSDIFRNKPSSPISSGSLNCSSPIAKRLQIKCSSNEGESMAEPQLRDLLSGMVDQRVEELLNSEENKVLLDDLGKATRRVNDARKELAEIEIQEKDSARLKDYVRQLETRTSEIAECQKELSDARAMVEEAECSLSLNMDEIIYGDASQNRGTDEMDKEAERWESIKVSSISALVGTLAGLPISLQSTSSSQLILHLAVNFISCALFGVTFRYAVRRNLDNIQLKIGTSAAFGLIKGLSELESGSSLEFDASSFLSHAVDGAVQVSENIFIFMFASIALDYCFKTSLLSPFPIRKSVSRTSLK